MKILFWFSELKLNSIMRVWSFFKRKIYLRVFFYQKGSKLVTTFSFWSQNSFCKERTNSKLPLVIASHSNFVCGTGYTEHHAVCPLPALRWESDLLQQIRFLCGMPREKQCRKQTACVFFPFYPEPHKNVDIIKNLTWCF